MSDIAWSAPRENLQTTKSAVPWTQRVAVVAVVMLILFSTHSFQFLFAERVVEGLAEESSARSSPYYAAMFLVQFSLFLVLLFFHVLRNGIKIPLVVAAGSAGFVASSIFWSVSPGQTLAPAILFSYSVMAAYTASTCLAPRVFIRLYFAVCAFILASSFFVYFLYPQYAGAVRFGGGWLQDIEFSGVMSSKNYAGSIFAGAAILALNGRQIGIGRFWRLVVLGMALAAVILSNSATAVVIVIVLGGFSLLLRSMEVGREKLLRGLLVLFIVLIVVVPFISAGSVLQLLGRDATFTGRIYLWNFAYQAFLDYPLLGYGYNAFFDSGKFSPVWELWENFQYFHARNFHNSSVEILISLGLVGVAVMVVTAFKATAVVNNESVDRGSRLCLGLLLGSFLIGSMMEFSIYHYNFFGTFVLFYSLFAGMWQYNK